jgi:broad specificity phosphatase PhoE
VRFLFVRHGESQANVLRVLSNRGWKHGLTDRGRDQIRELAEYLRTLGVVAIHASPLLRAVESAEIVGAALGLPHRIEPALIEFDVGVLEGRSDPAAHAAYDEVEKKWLNGHLEERLPEGESCAEIHARFVPFVERMRAQYGDRTDGALVLIGHGGTLRHGLPEVLSNVSREFAAMHTIRNGAWVDAEPRAETLLCHRWGDVALD